MKVSLNWAQYYSNVPLNKDGTQSLLSRIGAQLGAVEEVIEWGDRLNGIVVAKVLSCQKHPNADRLHVCTIDDGGVVKGVKRNEDGSVQVVCGAPNVREGLLVAWLPPGTTVPATVDTDPFVLAAREIRGFVSNGMLASPAELGISDEHAGIAELSEDEMTEDTKPGTPLTDALWLNDEVVIDCENKMFTHRPDCFGILGVARELAGIQGLQFESPEWYMTEPRFSKSTKLELVVKNEAPKLVPRLMTVVMDNVTMRPSPLWLQYNLRRVGIKPINVIVDLTNYYMHLTGQPMHAYDYDKLTAVSGGKTPKLIARMSTNGEKIALLNGKTIKLENDQTIVIATDQRAVGIAGVMGGSETEVDTHTKTIVLECATFDMYNIRRTSMKYGLFTDAVTRYTKGQSALQNARVLSRTMEHITKLTGAVQISEVTDLHATLKKPGKLQVHIDFINERLGTTLTPVAISKLLSNVEITCEVHGKVIDVLPPFWRTDLSIDEDIVEEVGRLYGYDKVPVVLPARTTRPASQLKELRNKFAIRTQLAAAGANELLTYSFVHGKLMETSGQNVKHAYQLTNALSPELQYYRLSLTPSLLERVHSNIKAGAPVFALFEINKVHTNLIVDKEGLPIELEHLGLVFAADGKTAGAYTGAAYFMARTYLDFVLGRMQADGIQYVPLTKYNLEHAYDKQFAAPFDPNRSAAVVDSSGWLWGIVGEYRASVRRANKLPSFTAGFELNLRLFETETTQTNYQPLSRFPSSSQDITFETDAAVDFSTLDQEVSRSLKDAAEEHGYRTHIQPLTAYQKTKNTRNTTFRITLSHPERTLTTAEINLLLEKLAATLKHNIGTERV